MCEEEFTNGVVANDRLAGGSACCVTATAACRLAEPWVALAAVRMLKRCEMRLHDSIDAEHIAVGNDERCSSSAAARCSSTARHGRL